jgi:hypothetical protein
VAEINPLRLALRRTRPDRNPTARSVRRRATGPSSATKIRTTNVSIAENLGMEQRTVGIRKGQRQGQRQGEIKPIW